MLSLFGIIRFPMIDASDILMPLEWWNTSSIASAGRALCVEPLTSNSNIDTVERIRNNFVTVLLIAIDEIVSVLHCKCDQFSHVTSPV